MQTAIDPVPSPSQNASTEARLARLETHIEHINANLADLRVGSNRLETQVDQGFARLDAKMDAGFARLDADMDDGFARLDADIDGFARLDDKTAGLDGKMDSGFARLDGKIAGLDDKMDGGFARLDAKIDRNFLILGGMVVSLGVGMAGMMAKGFQWL